MAEKNLSWNLNRRLVDQPARPVWQRDDTFWYHLQTRDGDRFVFVDPEAGVKRAAFDHGRLAEALTRRTGYEISAERLPFLHFDYVDDREAIRFGFREKIWRCDIIRYRCSEVGVLPQSLPASVDSPDGRFSAFVRDYNLWLLDREMEKEIRLTEDGKRGYGYATDSQGWTRSDRPILVWSPDSRRIATFRQDEREVGLMPIVRTGEPRPTLTVWPYALPGDSAVPMLEPVVLDLDSKSVVRLDMEPIHQRTSNCCGLVREGRWADVEWSGDSERLALVETSRDYRQVTLYLADPRTGKVSRVYSESDDIFFESNLAPRGVPNWRALHDSGEFVWFSRRDGWGHLYLHDLSGGEQLSRITEGEWNVVDLVRIDRDNRKVYFTAVGREPGDPYFVRFYRAGLDDGEVELLTGENGNHDISLSPSGRWFTSSFSRPDRSPELLLKSADGGTTRRLERTDTSRLQEAGFRYPLPFSVNARDGTTDLYGLLIKPFDFDPDKRYPIVVSIYPGPQTGSVGTRGFTTFRRGQAHAIAQLGVVVMLLDGFGTPFRSREFHTWWYGDLSDNGLEDQIGAIRQLAERYDWIDADRAGIYGHSGGGYAAATAMLRFPEQFRVGVAGAGNMDNRGYTDYWGEKYQGPLERLNGEESYENQAIHRLADRLKGRLLVTWGTMDTNVHPNMTLRLVDSLIQHNRDFDLMVFPDRGHGYANEPYKLRITWDYFVRHLLEGTPPQDYRIGSIR